MSFRKENKFRLTVSDMQLLKSELISKGMAELYPEREVQSTYLDTREFRMFQDSNEGVLPRKKIRIRTYNNQNKFTQETKISSEEGRYKKSKVLFFDCQDLYNCKSILDKDYGIIMPTILISYSRSYFSFRGLRFTFDNNIEYTNLRAQIPWKCRDPECVMEIKTEFYIEDDYISDVIKIATSRFSKYCRGIEMLNELANYN